MPDRILTVVLLPAPLGPDVAHQLAGADAERHLVEGGHQLAPGQQPAQRAPAAGGGLSGGYAEALGQTGNLDQGRAVPEGRPAGF